jgi:hypothetical protein
MGNRNADSKWLKASLELEAAIGDDADAYLVDESELNDLLGDELEAEIADDEPPYADEMSDDRPEDEDSEDPLLVWDEDEGRFV